MEKLNKLKQSKNLPDDDGKDKIKKELELLNKEITEKTNELEKRNDEIFKNDNV